MDSVWGMSVKIICIFVSLFAFLCGVPKTFWKTKILFQREVDRSNRCAEGESTVSFFIINKNKLLDSTFKHYELLISEQLRSIRPHAVVLDRKEFERQFLNFGSKNLLLQLYASLESNNMVAMATNDSIWKPIRASYFLLFRIVDGIAIRSFEGSIKRSITIETELWDVKNREVLWRVSADGTSFNTLIREEGLMQQAVSEVFKTDGISIPEKMDQHW